MSEPAMARKDHATRLATLAAKIESPQVLLEIDKVLREMRQEWLDIMDLRKSAVRRHGEKAKGSVPPIEIDPAPEERAASPAAEPESEQPKDTISSLAVNYKSDPDSRYSKLLFKTREHYDSLLRLLENDYGNQPLSEINGRILLQWHDAWSEGGKRTGMAHAKIGMLRRLFSFGATILENKECVRLSGALSNLRFKSPKKRTEQLTAEHASAIRAIAHKKGRASIALAQAFQFDLDLRQKSVIGQWTPASEPGDSDIEFQDDERSEKWLHGLRWEEIDENLVLKRGDDDAGFDLRDAPMVLEELKLKFGFDASKDSRSSILPPKGAIVVSEWSELPWTAIEFRRWWRICADAAGVPSNVRNMDSRQKIGRRTPEMTEDEALADDQEDEEFEGEEASSLH